jgi:hypothetical protein
VDFGIEDLRLFNMDLSLEVNSTLDSDKYRDAFTEARCKWMEVITGNLPSESIDSIPPNLKGDCTNTLPSLVDDLHICGRDTFIDGPFGIAGRAGPKFIRTNATTGKQTTVTGEME